MNSRSVGSPLRPRRSRPRASRSVGSPARSNESLRLSSVVDQFKENNRESLHLSPFAQSVLADNTEIDVPRRKSWWKIVNESREVLEALENNQQMPNNNIMEELAVEVLSQETEGESHPDLDLPESSGSESIGSIVVPRRKLFTQQKEHSPQTKFREVMGRRESLAHQNNTNIEDKTANIRTKTLFSHGANRKKPTFPAALLNLSVDKTIGNKTKDIIAEPKAPPRSLFGNHPGTKRKNMFADFIVSDSEDDISEIQPKTFAFAQNKNPVRHSRSMSRGFREPSPSSSATDIEMDDWKMLPSSTMAEIVLDQEVGNHDRISGNYKCANQDHTDFEKEEIEMMQNRTLIQQEEEPFDGANEETLKESIENPEKGDFSNAEQNRIDFNEDEEFPEVGKQDELRPDTSDDNKEHTKSHGNAITDQNKSQVEIEKDVIANSKNVTNTQENIKEKSFIQEKTMIDTQIHERSKNCNLKINEKSGVEALQTTESNYKVNYTKTMEVDEMIEQETHKDKEVSIKQNVTALSLSIERAKENRLENKQEIKEPVDKAKEVQEKTSEAEVFQNEELAEVVENEVDASKNKSAAKTSENTIKVADVGKGDILNNNEAVMSNKVVEQSEEHEKATEQEYNKEAELSEKVAEAELKVAEGENDEAVILENEKALVSENEQNEEAEVDIEAETDIPENEEKAEVSADEMEEQVSQNEEEAKESENEMEVESENEMEVESENEMEVDISQNKEVSEDTPENEEEDENVSQNEEVLEDTSENEEEVENVSQNEEKDKALDNEASNKAEVITETEMDAEDSEVEEEPEAEDLESEDAAAAAAAGSENEEAEDEEGVEASENEAEISDNELEEENESQEIEEDQNDSHEIDDEVIESEEPEEQSDEETNQENQDTNEHADQVDESENVGQNELYYEEEREEQVVNEESNQGKQRQSDIEEIGTPNLSEKERELFKKIKESVPLRESTGISDGTNNSSGPGSGWDSHRTTRKTLRQTFGRDFTPRKSLRTLVMEKSAKRQTMIDLANAKLHKANSTEIEDGGNLDGKENVEPVEDMDYEESDCAHEVSKQTRQTTLEMYLQKIKKNNLERKQKIEREVQNLFKPNPVKVWDFKKPLKPLRLQLAKPQPLETAPKAKRMKPNQIPLEDLPPELIEDMKYRPPKRFKPSNASWITNRLYKFMEDKLEPRYDYKARVRAEALVQKIYNFVRDTRRDRVAPPHLVTELKKEMARLQIVVTHADFYDFFNDFMPWEVIIKVVPDIVNDIPLPREGVFSEIQVT